jgi:hypothetical protein
MSQSPPITLPAPLQEWAEQQAGRRGVSVSEYLADLLRLEQARTARDRVDAKLLEAIDSGPAAEMTPQDWQDVRASTVGGRAMAKALEQLTARGALSDVTDPAQWQREVRSDRELPGRPTAAPDAPDPL